MSLNPRGSFGERLLDGLQFGLCDVLGLFIRCAAKIEKKTYGYTPAGRAGRVVLAGLNAVQLSRP